MKTLALHANKGFIIIVAQDPELKDIFLIVDGSGAVSQPHWNSLGEAMHEIKRRSASIVEFKDEILEALTAYADQGFFIIAKHNDQSKKSFFVFCQSGVGQEATFPSVNEARKEIDRLKAERDQKAEDQPQGTTPRSPFKR